MGPLTKDVLGLECALVTHLLAVVDIVTYSSQSLAHKTGPDIHQPM